MSYKCNICGNTFTQNFNLTKHLKERRCKGDLLECNNLLKKLLLKHEINEICNNSTQTFSNSYGFKKYIMPSGRIINYQGYENIALDKLLSKHINEDDIVSERNEVPIIEYKLHNKVYKYYPDIYIKSKNLIIEVKSVWTYKKNIVKNTIKALKTKESGFNFEFWIYNKKKELIIV